MASEKVSALAVVTKTALSLAFISSLVSIAITVGFGKATGPKNVPVSATIGPANEEGQNAQTPDDPLSPDAPIPKKKRGSNRPMDYSKIILPSFSLETKAEKTSAQIGEKLKVEVIITNTSDKEDMLYDGFNHVPEFELEVHDEAGRELALVPGSVDVVGGSSYSAKLHPGESLHRFARLDKEFKLDKPGNYFVQATRGVSKTNLRRSNTITITIIP